MNDSLNTLNTNAERLAWFMEASTSADMKHSKTAFRYFADHLEVFNFGYPIVLIDRYNTHDRIGVHVVLTTERVRGFPMERTIGLFSPEAAQMIVLLAAKFDDRDLVSRTWKDLTDEQKDWMIERTGLLPIEWKSREVMDRPEMAEAVTVYLDWEPAIGEPSPSDFFAKDGDVGVNDEVHSRKAIVDVPLPPAEATNRVNADTEVPSFSSVALDVV